MEVSMPRYSYFAILFVEIKICFSFGEIVLDKSHLESTERAANFSFGKCRIPVGAKIEYYDNPQITATVVDDRSVEYSGETMSLTALAKLLSGKKYAIAGPKFFKYKGERLNDIRHRLGV